MFIFVKLTSWYSFVIYFQSYYEHWYIEDHLRSSVSAFLWWWWGWFRTRFLMFGFMSLRPNKCNTMWTRAEWKNELIENIEIYTIASVKEWSQANRRVILCVILIVEYTKEILHASIHTQTMSNYDYDKQRNSSRSIMKTSPDMITMARVCVGVLFQCVHSIIYTTAQQVGV